MKKSVSLLIALVFVLLISGCTTGPQCPTCPNPSTWSECDANAVKTRTNYKCSEDTDYECESYTESQNCATEIRMTGQHGLDVVVTPTVEEKVKGTLKAEAVAVPENTIAVLLFVFAGATDVGSASDEDMLVKLADSSGSDGWKIFLETTELENGLHTLMFSSMSEMEDEASPWGDMVVTQIIVNN